MRFHHGSQGGVRLNTGIACFCNFPFDIFGPLWTVDNGNRGEGSGPGGSHAWTAHTLSLPDVLPAITPLRPRGLPARGSALAVPLPGEAGPGDLHGALPRLLLVFAEMSAPR